MLRCSRSKYIIPHVVQSQIRSGVKLLTLFFVNLMMNILMVSFIVRVVAIEKEM